MIGSNPVYRWQIRDGLASVFVFLTETGYKSYTSLKAFFDPNIRWEKAIGSAQENERYCSKADSACKCPDAIKWQKHGVPAGDGQKLGKQGQRSDWSAYFTDVKNGATIEELATNHPRQFATGWRAGERLKRAIRAKNRDDIGPRKVYVLWGSTGCGKSRWCKAFLKQHYGSSVFFDVDKNNSDRLSFESYDGQQAIFIDEYARGGLSPETLKKMTDRYPCTLPGRGESTFWAGTCVLFTSQQHPQTWFTDSKGILILQDYKAFLRRCTAVWRCGYDQWEAELCGAESIKVDDPTFRAPNYQPILFPNPWNPHQMIPSNPAYLESQVETESESEDTEPPMEVNSYVCQTETLEETMTRLYPDRNWDLTKAASPSTSNQSSLPAQSVINLVSDSEVDPIPASTVSAQSHWISTNSQIDRGLLAEDYRTPLPDSDLETTHLLSQSRSHPSTDSEVTRPSTKHRRVLESDSEIELPPLQPTSTTGTSRLMDSNGSPIWLQEDNSEYGKQNSFRLLAFL